MKRRIVITIPDDMTEEQVNDLHCAVDAQCESDSEGDEWSNSIIHVILSEPPRHEILKREPHFTRKTLHHGVEVGRTDFWFDEMMMYRHNDGVLYPLSYDDKGDCLDFFDHTGDCYWIDLGEDATMAYKNYCADKVIEKELSEQSRSS